MTATATDTMAKRICSSCAGPTLVGGGVAPCSSVVIQRRRPAHSISQLSTAADAAAADH